MKRVILFLCVLASATLNGFFITVLAKHYDPLRPTIKEAYQTFRYRPNAEQSRSLDEVVREIEAGEYESRAALIDNVRNFVHSNSMHGGGGERSWNTPDVIRRLHATYFRDEVPVHLTCGPRALAMQTILRELGIESRFAQLFSSELDHVSSHSVLDVFNAESGRWEMHDPDFNVYLLDTASERRASTVEAVVGDLDRFVLARDSGTTGWEELDLGFLRAIYSSGLYDNLWRTDDRGIVKKTFIVNRDRFDDTRTYPENGDIDIGDFMRRRHGSPVFVYF